MSVKKNKTDPVKRTWDSEWKKYNRRPYFKPNKRVVEVIAECFRGTLKGRKIIELGAGSGSDIISLIKKGAIGYGLDFSKESLWTMNYWATKKDVDLNIVKATAEKIPFPDNYFDCVYSVGLMEHFVNPLPLFKEQIRVLKPGGFLLIDVPQKFTPYTIAKHIRMIKNTHPFGWETEYSKSDLIKLANRLRQEVFLIYGRDSDILSRFPKILKSGSYNLFSKYIEKSFLAPYLCLCIGIVFRIKNKL